MSRKSALPSERRFVHRCFPRHSDAPVRASPVREAPDLERTRRVPLQQRLQNPPNTIREEQTTWKQKKVRPSDWRAYWHCDATPSHCPYENKTPRPDTPG